MKRTVKHYSGDGGFTMIEIIAVLLIIGILTVVAVAWMWSSQSNSDLTSQVDVVKNHLRYAQIRAMNTDTVWGINFNSTTTYYLFQGAGSTTPINIPGEQGAIVDLVAKKSKLTITPPTGGSVTFDSYGSPGSATITIATNGGNITVTENTGFIP
jgi:prepilin-type N-terminal cleavage/methylation domain-containing protein